MLRREIVVEPQALLERSKHEAITDINDREDPLASLSMRVR